MLSRSIPKWAQKISTIRKTFIKTFAIARCKSNMWAIYGKKLVMPLEAKLATNSFQFHVHPHYKAKSKNVNSLCSYLQVPQITKSLESFDILPQQYRTKEVSKTLIMQLSFFGVQNRLRHVLRYKCINLCSSSIRLHVADFGSKHHCRALGRRALNGHCSDLAHALA